MGATGAAVSMWGCGEKDGVLRSFQQNQTPCLLDKGASLKFCHPPSCRIFWRVKLKGRMMVQGRRESFHHWESITLSYVLPQVLSLNICHSAKGEIVHGAIVQ